MGHDPFEKIVSERGQVVLETGTSFWKLEDRLGNRKYRLGSRNIVLESGKVDFCESVFLRLSGGAGIGGGGRLEEAPTSLLAPPDPEHWGQGVVGFRLLVSTCVSPRELIFYDLLMLSWHSNSFDFGSNLAPTSPQNWGQNLSNIDPSDQTSIPTCILLLITFCIDV